MSAYAAGCIGALALAVIGFTFVFGGAILDIYGKREVERAFTETHPGSLLRIGQLAYSVGANCLVAQFVTLSATNALVKIDRISLAGVRWPRLLWGTAALGDVFAKARVDATNLAVEFPKACYGIRCARLRASVPGSELIAEGTELRTLAGDEAFFAAHHFRTARFHVVMPECRVSGLVYGELFLGKSYRARSAKFSRPSLDVLVNLDKPVEPFVKSPLMVNDVLAAIGRPLEVDGLSIANGSLRYGERAVAGADPGVLTFSAVNLSAEGIANRGKAPAAIQIRAEGALMDTGKFKVLMSIPITPPDFSFHYSGSLSGMDLTNLDGFLDVDARTRIKSGTIKDAAFQIDVTAGQARGRVRAIYENLEIAFLDARTGAENGFDSRVASFLAKALKFRSSNAPDASGLSKEGDVNYTRRPDDGFQQFAWFALRTGILDIISQ